MKSTKRQDEILSVAKMHFATLGYDSATLSEIAADAKTAKSTLSYYFNTKEQLFDLILRDPVCNFSSRMVQIAVSRCSVGIRIAKMARTYFHFVLSEGEVQVILEKEATRLSQTESFEYIGQAHINIDDAWQHVVADAVAENASIKRHQNSATAVRVFEVYEIMSVLDDMACDQRTKRYLKDKFIQQVASAL